MREISIYWRKDGKRVMAVGSGKSVKEIVIGSVKIKKKAPETALRSFQTTQTQSLISLNHIKGGTQAFTAYFIFTSFLTIDSFFLGMFTFRIPFS